ncbi:hypothetical protein Tco_0252269, partial [Tanacetum coccineum]
FRNNHKGLLSKEIEGPEALDYAEFSTLLFRIREQVVREYVFEFLSSFKFRDHVVELDIADTMRFQLGGVMRCMYMRHFILALRLYTPEEMNNNLFEPFHNACLRNKPNNYNPTKYFVGISTRNHYDTRHPPSYTTIKNLIRRLVHRLLTLSVAGRHGAKEKVTLNDLFLLHIMDGGEMVDVPWTMSKFIFNKAKGYKKKSLIVGAHLIGRIARYNGLGYSELVDDQLDDSEDAAAGAEARRIREENERGVRHRPNMSFTNRLREMDERMGDMDTNIFKLRNDVDELIAVVSGMSEQYDQFYKEFNTMREEQQRFYSWEMDHLSHLLAHRHIDHTRYDSTQYSYVLNIPDLGFNKG